MWDLWIQAHVRPPGAPEWEHGGKFDSISLAARRILTLEQYEGDSLRLSVTIWTQFGDDEASISHYVHDGSTCRYAIRKRDPKPKKGII